MTATQKVFQELPETFTRKQVLAEAKKMGYSFSLASSLPARFLYADLAIRQAKGTYQKITN